MSFKTITDEDIDFVEMKIKERGEKFAKKAQKVSSDGTSSDSMDPVEIFGETYAKSLDQFQFLRGDRNVIKSIVSHVQKLVDNGGENKGLAQFKEKKRKKNKNVQRLNFDENAKENLPESKTSNPELANELYRKVVNCLISYDVDVTGYHTGMVHVDPSGAYGNIECILCDGSNDKQNTKRVTYYQPANRTAYWVLSNFKSHLETKHKLVAVQTKSANKKAKANADLNSVLMSNEHSNDDNCHHTDFDTLLNETSQREDLSVEFVDVEIELVVIFTNRRASTENDRGTTNTQ